MGGLRPSGLHMNKPALVGIVALFVVLMVAYKYLWIDAPTSANGLAKGLSSDELHIGRDRISGTGDVEYRPTLNLTVLEDPPVLDETTAKLAQNSNSIDIEVGGKKMKVHVEQVINEFKGTKLDILFLHGMSFSSKNWLQIKAMQQVANWGHRAIAVDLPGHGATKDTIEVADQKNFLSALISALQMKSPVIISPSYSGAFSLSFLFSDPAKSTELASGFVPVAPTQTSSFKEQYASSQLPTLIVYGVKDSSGERTMNDLRHLPKSMIAPVPDAGHACYLDNPKAFFKYLYHFLKKLKKE